MGGSESKATVQQVNENLVINRSDINIVNKTMNEIVANAILKNSEVAAGSAENVATVNIVGITVISYEDINIDIGQDQQIVYNFDVTQVAQIRNDAANKMIDELVGNLENNHNQEILSQLEATAQTHAETGFGSVPWAGSDTESDIAQITRNSSITINNKNLENLVHNAFKANFTSENVKECISNLENVAMANLVDSEFVSEGDVNFSIDQNQSISAAITCAQETDITNSVIGKIVKALDIQIDETSSTGITSETEGDAESESITRGFDDFIESIGTAIGNIFGGVFGGSMLMALSPFFLFCCCCLFLLLVVFGMSSGSGSSEYGDDYGSDYGDY